MKKTKVFRPRRGLRISGRQKSSIPQGGFIGASISDVAKLSASVMTSAIGRNLPYWGGGAPTAAGGLPVIISSSFYIESSISTGRSYEKKKLNAKLLGLQRYQTDKPPWPSIAVMDLNPTGTFVQPSWTNVNAGFNQAFVGLSLTSSYVETKSLNYFLSGTEPLENSPVPASASMFYSKASRLQTIMVKHTASASDTNFYFSGTTTPIGPFAPGTGVLCNTVHGSGTVVDVDFGPPIAAPNNPACILISVPVSGKLVDIKVWVELVHISGTDGGGAGNHTGPLSTLGLSLKNPNLTWGHAHPIYNDKKFQQQQPPNVTDISERPPLTQNFYENSFLLWEGSALWLSPYGPAASALSYSDTDHMPCWQSDRCMRTVFSDGSPVENPRHLELGTTPFFNFSGAPNEIIAIANSWNTPRSSGFNVPWTSNETISHQYQAAGSPPVGWLTGKGGVTGTNEWPTTGSNYGTNSLKPIYPMLDSIFIHKPYDPVIADGQLQNTDGTSTPQEFIGFRPGLRGSEISGTWQLMITNNTIIASGPLAGINPMDLYFRQVRLEITYETPQSSNPNNVRKQTAHQSRRANSNILIGRISGTDALSGLAGSGTGLDAGVTEVYTTAPSDSGIGRTFGMSFNSGSFDTDYALLYRLSGALGDKIGEVPWWLTKNESGMPTIPLASSSLVAPADFGQTVNSGFAAAIPNVINGGLQTLADVASNINPQRTLAQLATDFVSGSLS